MQGWGQQKAALAAAATRGPVKGALVALLLGTVLIGAEAHAGVLTRTSAFEYDPTTGLLTKEIVEPDDPQLRLETAYTRDAFGNVVSTTVSSPATGDAAITSRTTSTGYDAQGRFATRVTNALLPYGDPNAQSESRTFNPDFGGMASLTGPNGLTTNWEYDSFGRKTKETRADGTQTTIDYQFCSGVNGGTATCPAGATYVITTTPLDANGAVNGAVGRTYFDKLNRGVQSETQNFDGSTIVVQTQYDSFGRVSQKSRPYTAGGTPKWTTYQYDILGRVTVTTEPDGSTVTSTYSGLVTTATATSADTLVQETKTTTKNSQGQVAQVTDALNNTTSFTYDPIGNLLTTTDSASHVTSFTYDPRGRKIAMTDPDMGQWSYVYDALGQLVQQTDAKSQVTTYAYDNLGRMTSRTEPASGGGTQTSTWTYDASSPTNKGVGKLATASTSTGYSRTQTYDALGRPAGVSITIDGVTNGYATAYDAVSGRVATVSYPYGGFGVKYVYNAYGYLSEIRKNDVSNALFWQVMAMSPEGQVTQSQHGNNIVTNQTFDPNTGQITAIQAGTGNAVQNVSYTYDTLGRLTNRTDSADRANVVAESFQYDLLNRLTGSSLSLNGGTAATKTFAYNAIGNVTSKSDVGTYAYGTVPAVCPVGSATPGPHAVSEITGGTNPTFCYDANGNMTESADRALTWNAANLVESVTEGTRTLTFTYDTERSRIKQVTPSGTTTYWNDPASGAKAELFDGTSLHQWKNYIFSRAGIEVIYIQETTGAVYTRYLHKDHLGSTGVVTDDTGTILERDAYDPWGRRRYPDGTDDDAANTLNTSIRQTDKGFTGHEHLEEVALIHMNGRIYDPLIARFMSADPFVQSPTNAQTYNRYSYVIDNPLGYTDPTGYLFGIHFNPFKTFTHIYNGVTNAGSKVFHNEFVQSAIQIAAAATGQYYYIAAAAAFNTGVNGGDLGDMVKSAAIAAGTAYAFNQVGRATNGDFGDYGYGKTTNVNGVSPEDYFGSVEHLENIAGHAVVGCASGAASGGGCGPQALAAGLGGVAGPQMADLKGVYGVTASAALGGTASLAAGGKFGNGAVTGAYGYLYNTVAQVGISVGFPEMVAKAFETFTGVPVHGFSGGIAIQYPSATFGDIDTPFDFGGYWQGAAGGDTNIFSFKGTSSIEFGVNRGTVDDFVGMSIQYGIGTRLFGVSVSDPSKGVRSDGRFSGYSVKVPSDLGMSVDETITHACTVRLGCR